MLIIMNKVKDGHHHTSMIVLTMTQFNKAIIHLAVVNTRTIINITVLPI